MICPWCPPLPLGRASRRSASVRGSRDGCWQVQGQRFLGPLSFEVSTARRYVTHPYFAPPAMAEGSRIAAAEPHLCERSSGRSPRSYAMSRGAALCTWRGRHLHALRSIPAGRRASPAPPVAASGNRISRPLPCGTRTPAPKEGTGWRLLMSQRPGEGQDPPSVAPFPPNHED